jgi:LDH2 family malate/lactate/ureidoglycolate dehydrogenase
MQAVTEEILAEIRASAPAEGRGPVQVPGERERDLHAAAQGKPLMVPGRIWAAIEEMARDLNAVPD